MVLRHYHVDLNIFGALMIAALMVVVITLMHQVKLFRLLVLER